MRIRAVILREIFTKTGQLLRDVRSITRVAVTEIANVVSTVPRDTYAKTLVTSKKQAQGKDHVQLYCNENPTSDSEGNDHQKWAIIQGFEVSKRIAVTDNANIVSTLPKVTYAEA